VRLLSWNVFHGRDSPPGGRGLYTWRSRILKITERDEEYAQVNRPLLDEFAAWLAGHEWDVALLQEAPPRWLRPLAARAGAGGASALTSRNVPALPRALVADWSPDLIKSHEGGSNQLLVRPPVRIGEVRRLTLTRKPERRRMLWARLDTPEGPVAVANIHASTRGAGAADVALAAERAAAWAGSLPLVLGGDLNIRPDEEPEVFDALRERFGLAPPTAPDAIDHLLARGLEVVEPPRRLAVAERELREPGGRRIRLSDHAPVVATLRVR